MAAPEEQLEATGLGVRKVEFNPGFSPRSPLLQSKTFDFSLPQFPFEVQGRLMPRCEAETLHVREAV